MPVKPPSPQELEPDFPERLKSSRMKMLYGLSPLVEVFLACPSSLDSAFARASLVEGPSRTESKQGGSYLPERCS
jgi:hypothetical protein